MFSIRQKACYQIRLVFFLYITTNHQQKRVKLDLWWIIKALLVRGMCLSMYA